MYRLAGKSLLFSILILFACQQASKVQPLTMQSRIIYASNPDKGALLDTKLTRVWEPAADSLELVTYSHQRKEFVFQRLGADQPPRRLSFSGAARSFAMKDYYLWAPDSILLLAEGGQAIRLINSRGDSLGQWSLVKKLSDGDDQYEVGTPPDVPMQRLGNVIYLQKSTRRVGVLSSDSVRRIWYAYATDIGLHPPSGQLVGPVNPLTPLPAAIRSGANFYDFLIPRIITPEGGCVRAYAFSDSVYEYDATQHLRCTQPTTSKFFFPNKALPDGRMMDFDYLSRYILTQPRFAKILYDPYRQLYYRVLLHAVSYDNPAEGTHTAIRERPWSLLIFDENWQKRGEVVFPGGRYYWNLLFITRQGLVLARQPAEGDNPPPREWELFGIKPGADILFADAPTKPVARAVLEATASLPPTEVLGAYLQTNFGRTIPRQPHTWLVAPSGACVGCEKGTLLYATQQVGRGNVTLLTTPTALQSLDLTDAKHLRDATDVLVDSTGRLDRLALNVAGTAVIKTRDGQVIEVQALTAENTSKILRKLRANR